MSCATGAASAGFDFLGRLYPKALSSRIPLVGVIELTGQCNLRCGNCGRAGIRNGAGQLELTTRQWIGLIDQITCAGCLLLVLSGGECLLRPDFDSIYRHARSRGLLVTVLTNGTVLTDRTLRVFQAFPPHAIEVSLYGGTAEAYERVTGISGSFEKCMRGISLLQRGRFRLTIKSTAANTGPGELKAGQSSAAVMDLPQRHEAKGKRRGTSRAQNETAHGNCGPQPESGPCRCGAGMSMFHISPYGRIRPCQMVPCEGLNLLRTGFMGAWRSPDFELCRSALTCRAHGKKSIPGNPATCQDL